MSWRESKVSYKHWLMWYLPARLSWVALSFLRWCQVPHHPILQMVSHLSMLLCLSSLILNLSCSYCYYDSINYLLFWMINMKAFECFHNESNMKAKVKFEMKLWRISDLHEILCPKALQIILFFHCDPKRSLAYQSWYLKWFICSLSSLTLRLVIVCVLKAGPAYGVYTIISQCLKRTRSLYLYES